MTSRLVVVGSINVDMVLSVSEFPPAGETAMASGVDYKPGGKGANQAVAAAHAGVEVALIGAVGADLFGHEQLDLLRSSGVSTEAVTVADTATTGTAVVEVDAAGNNRIIVARGANALVDVDTVVAARVLIDQAAIVLISLEIPLDAVTAVVSVAAESNTPVIVNPAPFHELPEEILRGASFLTPNQHEATSLLGVDTHASEIVHLLSVAVEEGHIPSTLVSLGDAGAALIQRSGVTTVAAPQVNVIDTTGAGDTLNGVFAARLAQGKDLGRAVSDAVAAASKSVTWTGTRPPRP